MNAWMRLEKSLEVPKKYGYVLGLKRLLQLGFELPRTWISWTGEPPYPDFQEIKSITLRSGYFHPYHSLGEVLGRRTHRIDPKDPSALKRAVDKTLKAMAGGGAWSMKVVRKPPPGPIVIQEALDLKVWGKYFGQHPLDPHLSRQVFWTPQGFGILHPQTHKWIKGSFRLEHKSKVVQDLYKFSRMWNQCIQANWGIDRHGKFWWLSVRPLISGLFQPPLWRAWKDWDQSLWRHYQGSEISPLELDLVMKCERHLKKDVKRSRLSSKTDFKALQWLEREIRIPERKSESSAQFYARITLMLPWLYEAYLHAKRLSEKGNLNGMEGYWKIWKKLHQSYEDLAHQLVRERKLPHPSLIDYLSHDELGVLIEENRLDWVPRALQREKFWAFALLS